MADAATEAKLDAMLNINSIRLIKLTANVLTGDATLVEHFPSSDDSLMALAKTRLDAIKSVTIPPTQNKELWPGVWRVVSTEFAIHTEYKNLQGIVRTLKYGYASSLGWNAGTHSWSEARLTRVIKTPTSARKVINDTPDPDVTLSNTTSDGAVEPPTMPTDAEQFTTQAAKATMLFIRFPNIDPTKVQACVDSIAASYDQVTINGETYGSTAYPLHSLPATGGLDEDGAGYVELVLGSPQFTVKNGDGQYTTSATTTYVLHDVPASIGQSIVDAWMDGTTHRRAGNIGGYNATGGLCTVNLSVTPVVPQRFEFSYVSHDGVRSVIVQDEGELAQLTTDNALMTAATQNSFSGGKSPLIGRYNYGIIIKNNATEYDRWEPYYIGPIQTVINRKWYEAYVYVKMFANEQDAAAFCSTVNDWSTTGDGRPPATPGNVGKFDVVDSINGHRTDLPAWKYRLFEAKRVEINKTDYTYDE